jgi:hypothetical protein
MTSVRVVLDTTALLAYAQLKGMATAELVTLVQEEGGAALVGIPAACFMAAHAQLQPDERERLIRLATGIDGVTVILPLSGADTVEAAQLGPVMGHAIIETRRRDSYLATYRPGEALGHLPETSVLELGDD